LLFQREGRQLYAGQLRCQQDMDGDYLIERAGPY